MLEKTLESPLDCQKIKPVNPKGNQSWIFIGRTDAEADAPTLWSLDVKNWLIGKDPDAGKDWRREKKGTTEDEMVGWHHWLNGHEFEQAPGVDDGQGRLACYSPWRCKESDISERLKWLTDWGDSLAGIYLGSDTELHLADGWLESELSWASGTFGPLSLPMVFHFRLLHFMKKQHSKRLNTECEKSPNAWS